ncbi:MAG: hypothetical protein Q9159_003156 [Coniocarpon cinnabarinum]
MTLWILTETSAGYALHRSSDKKLLAREDISSLLDTVESVSNLLQLKKFVAFEGAQQAVEEAAAINEGKVTPKLASLLDELKDEKKVSLAVADPKLGSNINRLPELSVSPITGSATEELHRAIRTYMPSLIPQLLPEFTKQMSLGLSHSLSRHKLKFSADKVDVMIIQAISLLDDLDKEVNQYSMRTREWYGWHFPELGKILNDNLAFARVVLKMGVRSNAQSADLAEILPEDIEQAVKAAAEVSMGTEISKEDLDIISSLATQVVEFSEYRTQLATFLSTRMKAIAPNLTTLVGELVGARLIKHAGSLVNLSKSPASTIQILGAEKALFRALKTKHDTPKYGLIYHASVVGQASGKNKGKIARMLAAKAALGLRTDSMADWGANGMHENEEPNEEDKTAVGRAHRLKIDRRLRALEGRPLGPRAGAAIAPTDQVQPDKFNVAEVRKYNHNAEGLANGAPAIVNGERKQLIEEVDGNTAISDATKGDAETLRRKRSRDEAQEDGITTERAMKAARKAEKAKRKAEKHASKAQEQVDDVALAHVAEPENNAADSEEDSRSKAERKAAKAARKAEKAEKKKRKHDDTSEDKLERKKRKKEKHSDT